MSQLMNEAKKNDFGILGVLLKWLLIGGPQRKKGKPQKTFGFRFCWFMTAAPLLVMAVLFLLAKDGEISNLNEDARNVFNLAIGVFIFGIACWLMRAGMSKKKKQGGEEEAPSESDDEGAQSGDDE